MFDGYAVLPSGHAVFIPPVEFDLATVPAVEGELGKLLDQHTSVVIDLSAVEFIDSSGLAVLIWARQESVKRGGEAVLVGASERVLRLLEITQLDQVLPRYDSLADVPAVTPASPGPL
jgi:anti-sigma B factor antagonist